MTSPQLDPNQKKKNYIILAILVAVMVGLFTLTLVKMGAR